MNRQLAAPDDAGILSAFAQLIGAIRAGDQDVTVAPAMQLVIQQVEAAVRRAIATPDVIEDAARFLYASTLGPKSILSWNPLPWDQLPETSRVFWRMKAAGVLHAAVGS